MEKLKIGLALSGGAARGFAHIGVLKAFEREGVPVNMIAGTSSGAVVGAMYAAGVGIERMERIALRLDWFKDIVQPALSKDGLLSGEKLSRFIKETIPAKSFSKLKMPLSVVTVDIISRKEYIFKKGRLDLAIQASCSVPGIFKPVAYRNMLLVDGGILNNLPARLLKDMGAAIVVGIDVNKKGRLFDRIDTIFKVLLQSHYIMMEANTRNGKFYCDYVIEPDVGRGGFLALDRAEEFIGLGERAAIPVIKKIKEHVSYV